MDNSLARSATPWLAGGEEMQDTEVVHAIAPAAAIREVLVNPDALATPASAITAFTAALRRASSDPAFDGGLVKEVSLPASDPLVLAVGGTTLTANATTGVYEGETAWNTLPSMPGGHSSASGGGFSRLFTRPAYQVGAPGTGTMRGVPDVSADAGFSSGMAIAK